MGNFAVFTWSAADGDFDCLLVSPLVSQDFPRYMERAEIMYGVGITGNFIRFDECNDVSDCVLLDTVHKCLSSYIYIRNALAFAGEFSSVFAGLILALYLCCERAEGFIWIMIHDVHLSSEGHRGLQEG